MSHIIKIRDRRLLEDPKKRTAFRVRSQPIQDARIERFEREHILPSAAHLSEFHLQRFCFWSIYLYLQV